MSDYTSSNEDPVWERHAEEIHKLLHKYLPEGLVDSEVGFEPTRRW